MSKLTYNSASYGRVPEKAIKKVIDAPYGQAQSVIREFVPDFTMRSGDNVIYEIEIMVSGREVITVAAPSKEIALQLAEDYHLEDIDLDVDYSFYRVAEKQDVDADLEWEHNDGDLL